MINNNYSVVPCEILGVNIYPYISISHVIDNIYDKKVMLFSANAEILLSSDENLKTILNSGICYADGISAVKALHKKGYCQATKIPGCELWLEILKRSYDKKKIYLIGGTDEVISLVAKKLSEKFEGINIVGYRNGFFTDDEKNNLIKDIQNKKPDIVFVAMGFPRQELLTYELYGVHKALYMPIGGSFDVFSGKIRRAPKFIIDINLEWAYRLVIQPSRIKRQLKLFKFLYIMILNKI